MFKTKKDTKKAKAKDELKKPVKKEDPKPTPKKEVKEEAPKVEAPKEPVCSKCKPGVVICHEHKRRK